jgi:Haem-binding domain
MRVPHSHNMKLLKQIVKWALILVVVLVIGIQFVRPVRTNPPVDEAHTIFAHTQMSPEVTAIVNRSCADCHSSKTTWPWYSNVAPISWFVAGHVEHGRKIMNLSEWGDLDHDHQDRRLRQICDEVQDGAMPLPSYLPMHPAAKLSPADVKAICDWTDAERERMAKGGK